MQNGRALPQETADRGLSAEAIAGCSSCPAAPSCGTIGHAWNSRPNRPLQMTSQTTAYSRRSPLGSNAQANPLLASDAGLVPSRRLGKTSKLDGNSHV